MPSSPAKPPLSEDDLIGWLRRQIAHRGPDLLGQDTAYLGSAEHLVVTLDQQVEGVHLPHDTAPAIWARRLLAVNLSDLAAAGASPWRAFLAVAAPPDWDYRAFFVAFLDAAHGHRLTLAGGDLAGRSDVHLSLTLLGRAKKPGGTTRRSAQAGDRIWVGGFLGMGALGLALVEAGATYHLDPKGDPVTVIPELGLTPLQVDAARRALSCYYEPHPQLELGNWLADQPRVAAMDLSDGLARDLARWNRESGVGARLELAKLPLSPDFARLAEALGRDPVTLALEGGDDYVLLFSLPAGDSPPSRFGCHEIGEVTNNNGIKLQTEAGARSLDSGGWDHFENS